MSTIFVQHIFSLAAVWLQNYRRKPFCVTVSFIYIGSVFLTSARWFYGSDVLILIVLCSISRIDWAKMFESDNSGDFWMGQRIQDSFTIVYEGICSYQNHNRFSICCASENDRYFKNFRFFLGQLLPVCIHRTVYLVW